MSHNTRLRELADNTQFNIQLDTGDRLKRRDDQTVPVYDKMLTASAGASQVYATDWTRQDDLGTPISPGGTMVFRHTLGEAIFLANVNTYIGVIVDGRRTATLYTGAVRMDKNFIIVACPSDQTYSHDIVDVNGALAATSNPLYEMSMRVVITSGPTTEDGEGLTHYQDIPARFRFTSGSGTFVVPSDTNTLTMHVVGGGGCGHVVAPSQTVNHASPEAAMDGVASTVTGPGVNITANGGKGSQNGGAGGTATGGDLNSTGSSAGSKGFTLCSASTDYNRGWLATGAGGAATLDQTALDAGITSAGYTPYTCSVAPYGQRMPSGNGAGGQPYWVAIPEPSGSGSNSSWWQSGCGSGGGAGYARKTVSVTQGDVFQWSVGRGGTWYTAGYYGRSGLVGVIVFEWS